MSTTRNTNSSVEVILKDLRRRRWSPAEKQALVRRTYEPGMSVSLVARQEGVATSLLFQWRKLERQGALTAVSAGEAVAPASELAAARAEIAKLHRLLDTGETVNATFAKDCCDREVMAWRAWESKGLPGEPVREMLIEAVERRFGAIEAIPADHDLEFLSDNGGAYIAADTCQYRARFPHFGRMNFPHPMRVGGSARS